MTCLPSPGMVLARRCLVPLFEDIMALQQRAAADAECEAAYHCLMAALRLAEHQ